MMKRFSRMLVLLVLFANPSLLHSAAADVDSGKAYGNARERMVLDQIQGRGISNRAVLKAMETVPRHRFVPEGLRNKAYGDHPLPIGEGQTISQPYIVALMTETLAIDSRSKVLEIGTGSGYQAAVLSEITSHVYTIEIKEKLHKNADKLLKNMDYNNIKTRHGDGYFGWEAAQPFDAVMITAAVDHIPPPLLKQLKDGGRLVLPLGNPFSYQNLVRVTKKGDDYTIDHICGVLFVPMTGHAMRRR
jgi:protein-L-isoaspartate(D-aspartate) O-methyltransferase